MDSPHASSADEVANLLARLQTVQQLDAPIVDLGWSTYDQFREDIWGKSRKGIAEECMTVALRAKFLDDTLCIGLVRLAHLMTVRGAMGKTEYRRKIIQSWNNLEEKVEDGMSTTPDPENEVILDMLRELDGHMKKYVKKWRVRLNMSSKRRSDVPVPIKVPGFHPPARPIPVPPQHRVHVTSHDPIFGPQYRELPAHYDTGHESVAPSRTKESLFAFFNEQDGFVYFINEQNDITKESASYFKWDHLEGQSLIFLVRKSDETSYISINRMPRPHV